MALVQLGCSFLFFGGRFGVDVAPLPQNLNGKFPVAVDIVVVYDKSLEQQLAAMKATDWFDQRQQILRDHPGKVSSDLHEWVPGQVVKPLRITYRLGARSGFIFAHYFSPGDHRQQLKLGQNVLLRLGEKDFEVSKR